MRTKILAVFFGLIWIPLFSSFILVNDLINYTFHKASADHLFYGGLSAEYNGKTYTLIETSADEYTGCIDGFKEADFDNDGYKDVLIKHFLGCGGNGMPYNSFSIGFYNSTNDAFELTEQFGFAARDPQFLKVGDYTVIHVENKEKEIYGQRSEHYLLKEGKIVRTKIIEELPIPSNLEILPSEFSASEKENGKIIYYDLNADGEKDELIGEYWERWGSVIWSVKFSNGQSFDSKGGYMRIGILDTKTKGVNDLVCGVNDIWIWDGIKYVALGEE